MTSQRRERENDENQDGVDVGYGECDNVVFVRFELRDRNRLAELRERGRFLVLHTFSTIVSR